VLIEPRHPRSEYSRPRDLYAVAGGLHAKDAAMHLMVTSSLIISTLLHTSKSSDYALRLAENKKFNKDLRNPEPLQRSATQRFIPLVLKVRQTRHTHRDHAPRICLPPHQAILRLQSSPRPIQDPSDGGTSKDPFLLECKINVDCSTGARCPYQIDEDTKHTR